MVRRGWRAAAAAAVMWPACAWPQNLVVNPDFTSSLAGWTPSVVNVGGTSHAPASGSPDPGAAYLWAQYIDQFSSAALGQCVPIVAPGQVDLFARFRVTSGLAAERRVGAIFHASADCSGGGPSVVQSDFSFLPDGWTEIWHVDHTLPAGTQSAWVFVEMGAEGLPGLVAVLFDHVRFGPAGTTPVTLERFTIE